MSKSLFKLKRRNAYVAPATLGVLTLSSYVKVAGVAGSATIVGRTAGSTLTLSDDIGGLYSINSATGVLSWTSGVTSAVDSPMILETLVGATGSPKNSLVTLAVAGSTLVMTDMTGGYSEFAGKIPVFRDAYSAVSTLVDQNEEALDVQAIVGIPASPLATKVTLSGPDIGLFDKITGGKLVVKASARATITKDTTYALLCVAENAAGFSEPCTWYVYVAADADCRFVSFDKGTDSTTGNIGKLPSTPWKHCPDTMDWTGPATVLTGGKCIFFEGVDRGAKHATSLMAVLSPYNEGPGHTGTSTKSQRYCFNGWGGQAKVTGADDIPGSWTAASSSDIYNSGVSGVEKATLSTAAEQYNIISFGEYQGFPSQYPRPNTLSYYDGFQAAMDGTNNYNDTLGTADGGQKLVNYTTDPTTGTAPKYCYPSTGLGFIEDAKLDVRFNNASVAYNTNGIGYWLLLDASGNNPVIVPVLQYDVTLHRAYFSKVLPFNQNGKASYALLGSPYDVQVAGQYAFSPDGLVAYAKRPNSDQAVISRRQYGLGIGKIAYCIFHQPWMERFCAGRKRDGQRTSNNENDDGGGVAVIGASPKGLPGLRVYGLRSHQMYNADEAATLITGFGISEPGFVDHMFDRFHQSGTRRGGGAVLSCGVMGKQTGSTPAGGPTWQEIRAYATGKHRWWLTEKDSATRSLNTCSRMRGVEWLECTTMRFITPHGDAYAWYLGGSNFNDHNLMWRCIGIGVERWKTSSSDANNDHTVSQYNSFFYCVVLGIFAGNYGVDLYDGDWGSLYQQCIFVNDPSDTSAHQCFKGGGGHANMTLKNCVANGVVMSTGTATDGSPSTWTLDTVYLTGDSSIGGSTVSIPVDNAGANRRVLNCTRGTTKMTWDYNTVPSDWMPTLQKGATAGQTPLGLFHYV